MPPSRLFWPMLIGLLGTLVGIALSSPQTDASPLSLSPAPDATGREVIISLDPRWLDLVRAARPSGMGLQAATPSLHVHLTDRTVAGGGALPYPRLRPGEPG
jgi:hypothetical protein